MKPNMSATVKELLNVLGRHMPFYFKIIFANMWLFKGLVKKLFVILSADTRALLTSTFAFTMLNGGTQTNIIPNKVEANVNVRISPFDNVDSIIAHIKKVINDKDIVVTAVD
jgi:carboxypeptidase PM20D1